MTAYLQACMIDQTTLCFRTLWHWWDEVFKGCGLVSPDSIIICAEEWVSIIGPVEVGLQLRKDRQVGGGWIFCSARGVPRTLGAEISSRWVWPPQCVLRKAWAGLLFFIETLVEFYSFVYHWFPVDEQYILKTVGIFKAQFSALGKKLLTSLTWWWGLQSLIERKSFLFDYREDKGDRVWAKTRRAAVGVWLGCLMDLLNLEDGC